MSLEVEGEVVSLGNTDIKIRNLLRNVNARENDIRSLQSALQETQGLLAAARERISRLLGEKAMAPKIKKKRIAANRVAAGHRRMKKPGDPKREFSPEKLEKLRANMATARQARSEKATLRPET